MNPLTNWAQALDHALWGRPLGTWALALLTGLVVYLALRVGTRFVLRHLARLAQRTRIVGDDLAVQVIEATRDWILAAVALLAALQVMDLPERWQDRVSQLWFVVLVLQLALWVSRALKLLMQRHLESHAKLPHTSASATLLSWALQTALWTTVLLATLANLGVNITAMVTSLGVGGIAVALAVQNILGDLFASLAIALDKPFEVGDAIKVNNVAGTVESVGLKTTRIRAPSGEQIVMSNADMLKSAVSNYKRQSQRRVEFRFSLSLATSAEDAAAVPGIVRQIVESQPGVQFDRAHLKAIGSSALEYELVYIVPKSDYQLHMDVQQAICLALMARLQADGISFATPAAPAAPLPTPAAAPAPPRLAHRSAPATR